MTRARGNALQNALAAYLRQWWPHAESAGAGRNGTDVLGTPGVVWECKTAMEFKRDFKPAQWLRQAQRHRDAPGSPGGLPVVVYFPPGVGEMSTALSMAIMPLHLLMQLLEDGQYAPERAPVLTPSQASKEN